MSETTESRYLLGRWCEDDGRLEYLEGDGYWNFNLSEATDFDSVEAALDAAKGVDDLPPDRVVIERRTTTSEFVTLMLEKGDDDE
jgi:hypothetical protein